jgi:hypothetical protein
VSADWNLNVLEGIALIVASLFWIILFSWSVITRTTCIEFILVIAIWMIGYVVIESVIPPLGAILLLALHTVLWVWLIYGSAKLLRQRLKKNANIANK